MTLCRNWGFSIKELSIKSICTIKVQHISEVVRFMSRMYGHNFRVLMTVDNLDRCKPDEIMQVLEALHLLFQPQDGATESPYITLVAMDLGIVLAAITKHFDPLNRSDFTQRNCKWVNTLYILLNF